MQPQALSSSNALQVQPGQILSISLPPASDSSSTLLALQERDAAIRDLQGLVGALQARLVAAESALAQQLLPPQQRLPAGRRGAGTVLGSAAAKEWGGWGGN